MRRHHVTSAFNAFGIDRFKRTIVELQLPEDLHYLLQLAVYPGPHIFIYCSLEP
jgi:hypothetical protein